MKRPSTDTIALCLAWCVALTVAVSASERVPKWKTVRDRYIAAHSDCEACGHKAEEIHHIKPVRVYPELELDESNLIALCDRCHFVLGHLGHERAWNPLVREEAARHLERVKARPYTREEAEAFVKRFGGK